MKTTLVVLLLALLAFTAGCGTIKGVSSDLAWTFRNVADRIDAE